MWVNVFFIPTGEIKYTVMGMCGDAQGEKQQEGRDKWHKLLLKKLSYAWKEYRAFIVIVFILVAFFFGLCPLLNLMNMLVKEKGFFSLFVLNENVSDWFAFWGSFSGTIMSAYIGFLTFKLTKTIETNNGKVEEQRKEETKAHNELKNKMDLTMNLPEIECKKAELYSFNQGDICDEFQFRFPRKNNYCIFIELEKAFPVYFDINVIEMELEFCGISELITELIKDEDYSYTNHKTFELYINAKKLCEPLLEHLYLLDLEISNTTPYEKRSVTLSLNMRCENVLLPEYGGIDFVLEMVLQSNGKKNGCIDLSVKNILLKKEETGK